jgi:hypothetical protein
VRRLIVLVTSLTLSVPVLAREFSSDKLRERPFFPPDGSLIIVSQGEISFHIDGPPGAYDADMPVEIRTGSISNHWTISCYAEPLIGERGIIPPDRLFVRHEYSDPRSDFGAGKGYESLAEPVLVAEGSLTGPEPLEVNSLRFRIMTTWRDPPGAYRGLIRLTYLPMP